MSGDGQGSRRERGGAAGPAAADPAAGAGPHLRLGTRGSALARAQSDTVADALRDLGATVEVLVIRTAGDNRPPDLTWGEGAFVTAIEAALLDDSIDVAVHSAKDVPTREDARLRIAAYPPREDPLDALVGSSPEVTLASLPPGARIGTDSPRRVAFLLACRPDLRPHPLHGNVDTRLRRLAAGETDALVLAVAGLARLGLADRISERLPPDVLPPAPGQGALAVQCRAADGVARAILQRLDDPATRAAVEAERAFLAASGGGCRAPLGALASVEGDRLELLAGAADPAAVEMGDAPPERAADVAGATFTAADNAAEPRRAIHVAWGRRGGAVADGPAIASALAADLTAALRRADTRAGAAGDGSAAPATRPKPVVLVTREASRSAGLVAAMAAHGVDAVIAPTIAIELEPAGGPLDDRAGNLPAYAWVVVTSANGARSLGAAAARRGVELGAARFAAVGASTDAALAEVGGRAAFLPEAATGHALADGLPVAAGDRILVVGGDHGDGSVAARLRARGADVEEVRAYRTIEGPAASHAAVLGALRRDPDAIVFTSGSTVRGLLAVAAGAGRPAPLRIPACCIGPSTAAVARQAGFSDVREAPAQDVAALADIVARAIRSHDAVRVVSVPASNPGDPEPVAGDRAAKELA